MTLPIIQNSVTHLGSQLLPVQHNNYQAITDTPLDQISAQIVKTKDSALEVFQLFETGAAQTMWEEQKKIPSVTWLGGLFDKLWGWGRYHPEYNKKDTDQKRSHEVVQEHLQQGRCPELFVFRDNMNTSFVSERYLNKGCVLIDPVEYGVNIIQYIWKKIEDPNDAICRTAKCVTVRLNDCYPDCFPCLNATETEKNAMLNESASGLLYQSKYDKKMTWSIYIFKHNHSLNRWKVDQLVSLFNTTISDCEDQIYHPPQPSPDFSNAYYAFAIVPIVISAGVLYEVARCKRQTQYIPLKSVEQVL